MYICLHFISSLLCLRTFWFWCAIPISYCIFMFLFFYFLMLISLTLIPKSVSNNIPLLLFQVHTDVQLNTVLLQQIQQVVEPGLVPKDYQSCNRYDSRLVIINQLKSTNFSKSMLFNPLLMLQLSSVLLSLVYSVHACSYYTVVLKDQRKYLCFIFIDETHVLHR